MVLRLRGGDWRVWKAGRGTRQGDSTGSDIFCATYNEAVIAEKAARPARPHQVLQYNGRSVDPTLLTFVDDIAELTIDEKTKHGALHSIEQQIKENTETLVPALASIGFELELSKEVVVPVWMGTGSLGAAKRVRDEWKAYGWHKSHHSEILGRFHQPQWHQQHSHPETHRSGGHWILCLRRSVAFLEHQL